MATDKRGGFYEVNGGQLRPLGELVRDEHGIVFEVLRRSESAAAESTKEKPTGRPGSQERIGCVSKTADDNRAGPPPQPAREQAVPEENSLGYRKIVADPGLYLKIPWARVKRELAAQMKHPEKLSDVDEIECYAQIYEAQRTLAVANLAAVELGDGALHPQLHPLTRDKAQMLGGPQLFKPTRYAFETRASSRQIHAGQRVFRLWPVFDPTADRETIPDKKCDATRGEQPVLHTQIPERYLNPLHFKSSREEVLYDMKSALGTLPPESSALVCWLFVYPLRLLKTLITMLRDRRGMKKWRAMLEGRSPDDQLWAVTPPRRFSYHPRVRRWAEETLVQAAYEPGKMFPEWEIFWRRKA